MDPQKAKQYHPEPVIFKYNARDSIVYALGIGLTPTHDLHFLYENHENFQVFPTYAVAPAFVANSLHNWPGIPFNFSKILHGEQYIEQFEPLPTAEGEIRAECEVVDILDKGVGALILSNVTLYDNTTNKKLGIQQFSVFQIGSGKFGGNKTSPNERKGVDVPNGPPHKIFETQVREDQAALYRQGGGDMNPLHVDANFAKVAGFDQPILHGLCSLGIAAQQILRGYGENDAANFKAIKVRFSAPVIPGQTLVTETWQDNNRIHFQTKVKENGKIVLSNSYVDLFKTPSQADTPSLPSSDVLKSTPFFQQINDELASNKNLVSKINSIVLYDITKHGKHAAYYTLDLKNEPYSVYNDRPKDNGKASVTVTVDDDDFVQLALGKLDGMKAFMSGRLKIRGNIMLMQKLQKILSQARNTSKL